MQQVKVGLCAFGMSGKVFHAPFLREHPGFVLTSVVERTKNESAEKNPNAKIYRSVEEMLRFSDTEIVIVNTPVQTHFEYAKMALEAGKHVIVEKPFTVTAAEAGELVRISDRQHKFLSVYQNRRFDRDFLQVQKIISEQKLGTLKEVEIRFDRFRISRGGKEHKENPDLPGSGALHDLGAHLIDQATLLFGAPEKLFADVFAMKEGKFANDYFDVLLYFKTGLRVRLKATVFAKEPTYAYILHGDRGSFLQMRTDAQENELVSGANPVYGIEWQNKLISTDGILNYTEDGNETRFQTQSEPGDYMAYYDQVYRHLTLAEPLPSPASEIVLNMTVIEAALKSAATGMVVCLDEM